MIDSILSILNISGIYSFCHRIVGGFLSLSIYVKEYVRPQVNDKILDIGCGPGDILRYLPNVEYIGFDMSQQYIDSAKKRFGNRGTFLCNKVSKEAIRETSSFDIVLACGILHHLSEDEVLQLFELSRSVLKPEGRLVTLDGCYMDGQSQIVRYILSKDRGRYVRTREGYLRLASKIFSNIKVNIRNDLFRIPYTSIIMECSN